MTQLDWVAIVALTVVQLWAALHALLYKRDSRAATGWVAVSLMFPVAGPLLYFLFGINRVRTRARELVEEHAPLPAPEGSTHDEKRAVVALDALALPSHYVAIARISGAVSSRPLVGGNDVEALCNGEEAYPVMLDAVHEATSRVYLTTYIFSNDEVGARFVDALGAARARGVDVRVLVDGVGALYSLPRTIVGVLRRRGVPVARFHPPRLLPPAFTLNLRTHRKILAIDGRTAFAGGLNIGETYLALSAPPPPRATDVHFRLRGPVARQLEHAFLEDWRFATQERANTQPPPVGASEATGGDAVCRVITDGPDAEIDKLSAVLVGAVAAARRRVGIVTPYFIPNREMVSALQTAALRGVEVDIVLPGKSNLPYVHWATRNMLWELLRDGVRVHYQPPPFAHTKLFVVDERYAMIGSANIDPRSLRLNFEVGVEIYDRELADRLHGHIGGLLADARPVTYEEVEHRPLAVRLRDSLAWLLSPYL